MSKNGTTITFNSEGLLTDGQHRLSACVKAGLPITVLVVYGVNPITNSSVDIGRSRTLPDQLNLSGFYDAKVDTGAVVRAVYLYEVREIRNIAVINFGGGNRGGVTAIENSVPSIETLADFYGSDPKMAAHIDISVAWVRRLKKVFTRNSSNSVLGILTYIAMKQDPKRAKMFFEGLEKGENLVAGDASLTLRNTLLTHAQGGKVAHAKYPDARVLTQCLMAWNKYRAGLLVKSLNVSDKPSKQPNIW